MPTITVTSRPETLAPRPGRAMDKVRLGVLYVILLLLALLMLGPFLWLLSTSLRPNDLVFQYPIHLLPDPLTFRNYIQVWEELPIARYFLNSTVLTLSGLIVNIVLAAAAAYPLALLDFPGKNIIFYAILSTFFLPNGAGFIVNYVTLAHLHLTNTLTGVIAPGAVGVLYILIFRQTYITIPKDLLEAARLDGAGEFMIFTRLVLPIVRPAVSTVAIFSVVAWWNLFLWPVIILQNPHRYPLTVGLTYLNGMFNQNFAQIAAGTIISIVPVIIVFLLLQRYFISGIAGALKG